MKRALVLGLVLLALGVWAKGRKSTVNLTTAAPWGVPPTTLSEGIDIQGLDYVQCSVHGIDSTFSSGSVCWYRNPMSSISDTALDGDGGWEHVGTARQTATNVGTPDGGAIRRFAFEALKVGSPYGRLLCVACPLLGTADDAGTARFRVRTEGWATP